MYKMTSLGLDERLERVLAYLFLWVSGLLFFLFEKNRNVRWHAAQSIITFGALSLLMFGVHMLQSMFAQIPLINMLTDFGLGLLSQALGWTMFLLWIWLMIMAWIRPDYQLPFINLWVRRIV